MEKPHLPTRREFIKYMALLLVGTIARGCGSLTIPPITAAKKENDRVRALLANNPSFQVVQDSNGNEILVPSADVETLPILLENKTLYIDDRTAVAVSAYAFACNTSGDLAFAILLQPTANNHADVSLSTWMLPQGGSAEHNNELTLRITDGSVTFMVLPDSPAGDNWMVVNSGKLFPNALTYHSNIAELCNKEPFQFALVRIDGSGYRTHTYIPLAGIAPAKHP